MQNRSLKTLIVYLDKLHPDEFAETIKWLIRIERWYVDSGQKISEGEDVICTLSHSLLYNASFDFYHIKKHLINLGVFRGEPNRDQSAISSVISLEQLYKARLAYSLLPKKEKSWSGETFLTFEGREELSTCWFDRNNNDLVFDKGFGKEKRVHVKYSKYRRRLIDMFFTASRGRPIAKSIPTDELYDELYADDNRLPKDRERWATYKYNKIRELARKYNYHLMRQGLKNCFFDVDLDKVKICGLYTEPFFKLNRKYR